MKPRATPRGADGRRPPAAALVPLYQSGTRCPACAAGNWLVGRVSAECGQCGYPLMLAHPEKEHWS